MFEGVVNHLFPMAYKTPRTKCAMMWRCANWNEKRERVHITGGRDGGGSGREQECSNLCGMGQKNSSKGTAEVSVSGMACARVAYVETKSTPVADTNATLQRKFWKNY